MVSGAVPVKPASSLTKAEMGPSPRPCRVQRENLRQGLERVRVEHTVDVAVPRALKVGKQTLRRRASLRDSLDQRGERLAFVLAFSIEPRSPLQAGLGQRHYIAGDIEDRAAAKRRFEDLARDGVAPIGLGARLRRFKPLLGGRVL